MINLKLALTKLLLVIFLFQGYAADYYWIGGSGNWSEINHWATSSGGNITYAQTPTSSDNVIFDTNSFTAPNQTVTMDDDNIFARSLTISNVNFNPRFVGAENTRLSIYGSIDVTTNCRWEFAGTIQMLSNEQALTINFSNHTASNNFVFNGSGAWTLTGDLIVNSIIDIQEGTLSMVSSKVECNYFRSLSTKIRRINFDNAQITIRGITMIVNQFWEDDRLNIYPLHIDVSNWTSTSQDALIELTRLNSSSLIRGEGQITLPGLLYSSARGRSDIININQRATITLAGDLEARHNVNIKTALNLNNFVFSPGVNIGFLSGARYNFNSISGNGNCSAFVNLFSSPGGQPATFNNTAAFNLGFYYIRDITLLGPAATLDNSLRFGSTAGWNVSEKSTENFYWIGRSGNWSNPSNWSLNTGGPPAGCLPSAADNVIFDNNSFTANNQFITVDLQDVFCKDMSWGNIVNGAGLTGENNTRIIVYGSLTFAPNMRQNFQGDFLFGGGGQNSITSNGITFPHDIIFNNSAGNWTIKDNFQAERRVFLTSGELVFDNTTAVFNRFYSLDETSRSIDLKNSTLDFRNFHFFSPYFQIHNQNLKLLTEKSLILFSNAINGGLNIQGNNSIKFHNIFFNINQIDFTNWSQTPTNIVEANHVKFVGSGYIDLLASFDTLSVENGNEYIFRSSSNIKVRKLIQNSVCNGMVSFVRHSYTNETKKPVLEFITPDQFSNFSIREVVAQSSSPIVLTNSIDQGGNIGWTFQSIPQGRILYFVKTTNVWYDEANWSLTSGGPGGQCIPTEIDDVIFDQNSRILPNDEIVIGIGRFTTFCKNFTFNINGFNGTFNFENLNIFGNFTINQTIRNWYTRVYISGGTGVTQQIRVPDEFLFSIIEKGGKSTLELLSDIEVNNWINILNGEFKTLNHNITVGTWQFIIGNNLIEKEVIADLGTSTITLRSPHSSYNGPLIFLRYARVNGENSTIELTNNSTGINNNSENVRLGKVESTNIAGSLTIESFEAPLHVKNLIFRGNGHFVNKLGGIKEGKLIIDSLTFSPGKSYTYQSGFQQDVNAYLQARGNNCRSINIVSSLNGEKAILNMPSTARINMDFVQMRDIRATGGANFNAGPYSTNINNSNEGWTFPLPNTVNEEIGFLGPDQFLCPGEVALVVDANSYTPNETYRWSTGSTTSSIDITNSGLYHVTVTFGTSCILSDTIEVFLGEDITNFLPNDTTLCNLASLEINSSIIDENLRFLWNSGETTPNLIVTKSGLFKLSLQNDNCSFQDSVNVTFIRVDSLNFDNEVTLCSGDSITLSAIGDFDRWLWQDGRTTTEIQAFNAGIYWVEVTKGPCMMADTVTISLTQRPIFDLGSDTSFCEGNTLILNAGTPDIVRWSDGSVDLSLNVNRSGTYSAIKGEGNCTFSDTINVIVHPLPIVNLGNDITLCSGQSTRLNVQGQNNSVLWSTGSTNPEISINSAGTYHVLVTNNNTCQKRDTVTVNVITIIKPNLGRDTTFCANNAATLRIIPQPNTSVLWSTGVNTNSISVNTTGNFWVEISQSNCRERDTINIQVLPLPTITSPSTFTICDASETTITLQGIFDNILWSGGQTQPTLTITQPGQYPLPSFQSNLQLRRKYQCQFGSYTRS
jgi:hypothetical protein